MSSVLLLYVAVLLAVCGRGRAVECKKVDNEPCQCTFTDSDGSQAMIDISHYFNYPVTPISDNERYAYEFSCRNFQCPNRPNPTAIACQYIKTQEASTGLGLVNKNTTWEINNLADDKFQFVVTYKDGEGGRSTQVMFAHEPGDMMMKVVGRDDTLYRMLVVGDLVKKMKTSPPLWQYV